MYLIPTSIMLTVSVIMVCTNFMMIFQAIIYTMLNDKTSARNYYEEFQSIRQRFHWPDGIEEGSPLYGIVLNFDEFEEIVENLKKEIDHAHKLRAK